MDLARPHITGARPERVKGGPSWLGRWIRGKLRIAPDELSFERCGFFAGSPSVREHLARVPSTVHAGYLAALEEVELDALSVRLDAAPRELRGFAYEGGAMGLAMLDAFSPFRRERWKRLVAGPGRRYDYLTYVGLGLAAARLHRFRTYQRVGLDRLLRWLVVDGIGFHEGYFSGAADAPSDRPRALDGYALRAFDQGLGRSLWFVECADVERLAVRVEGFDDGRRADLWAGLGLASAYAGSGGDDPDELFGALVEAAGEHADHFAQGVVFAAEARAQVDNLEPCTERACQVVWSAPSSFCVELCARARRAARDSDGEPGYERWRSSIRAAYRGGEQR